MLFRAWLYPLNTSGCKDTHVDYEYVIRMMGMRSDNEARLLDYDGLRADLKDGSRKRI